MAPHSSTLPGKSHGRRSLVGCNPYKEGWSRKNWCFWTVVLEKPLESPLDCKKIQPVHPKGDQAWILIGKDPDSGKDSRQEEKGTTEDEMVGWHHRLNGHEFQQTLWESGGQRSLACFSPWGRKESDTTWRPNKSSILPMVSILPGYLELPPAALLSLPAHFIINLLSLNTSCFAAHRRCHRHQMLD